MVRRLSLLALLLVLSLPQVSWAKSRPTTHRVYPGHTLGKIAKRYNVSVAALCTANGISRRSPIKPGQTLVVPARSDKDGRKALLLRKQGKFAKQGVPKPGAANKRAAPRPKKAERTGKRRKTAPTKNSWRKYRKPARRAGYVTLKATGRRWSGYALVKGNRISSRARRGFRHALYSWRSGAEVKIDSRLIRVLTKVSDTFGGRPIKIASGYREHSYARESKHKLGRACDFAVEGVPNEAVRDYLRTQGALGVGYYPHSSFVHVDVRKRATTWVDYSRPGQRPRYKRKQKPVNKRVLASPASAASPAVKPLKSKVETGAGAESSRAPSKSATARQSAKPTDTK